MDSSDIELLSAIQDVLLEFRAGKMHLEGTRVVADPRKGLVCIGRGEEGLVHIQWLDRSTNTIEDDQIFFPEEAVFERVGQASGRVYLLKFETDGRKCFFWMQEPRADDDEELCKSVNLYLNQPLASSTNKEDTKFKRFWIQSNTRKCSSGEDVQVVENGDVEMSKFKDGNHMLF